MHAHPGCRHDAITNWHVSLYGHHGIMLSTKRDCGMLGLRFRSIRVQRCARFPRGAQATSHRQPTARACLLKRVVPDPSCVFAVDPVLCRCGRGPTPRCKWWGCGRGEPSFGPDPSSVFAVRRLAQVMWGETTAVGCGVADCSDGQAPHSYLRHAGACAVDPRGRAHRVRRGGLRADVY